jgi:hypothetical protein
MSPRRGIVTLDMVKVALDMSRETIYTSMYDITISMTLISCPDICYHTIAAI